MANVVEQIFDALTAQCATTLGAEWKSLKRVFDPRGGDFRSIEQAYGVRHGEARSAAGVTGVYTLDHAFEVVLVKRVVERKDSDDATQEVFNTLYNKADDLLRAMISARLGLASVILTIDNPSLSTPELMENGAAVLVLGVNIKYRKAIT